MTSFIVVCFAIVFRYAAYAMLAVGAIYLVVLFYLRKRIAAGGGLLHRYRGGAHVLECLAVKGGDVDVACCCAMGT